MARDVSAPSPTETDPLLGASDAADPEAVQPVTSNGSQNGDADKKDLGKRMYIIIPAVTIGVRSPAAPGPLTHLSAKTIAN